MLTNMYSLGCDCVVMLAEVESIRGATAPVGKSSHAKVIEFGLAPESFGPRM